MKRLTEIGSRHLRGEKNPNARLNDAKVRMIRDLWKKRDKTIDNRRNVRKIANRFRVGATTIEKVVRRQTWLHIK